MKKVGVYIPLMLALHGALLYCAAAPSILTEQETYSLGHTVGTLQGEIQGFAQGQQDYQSATPEQNQERIVSDDHLNRILDNLDIPAWELLYRSRFATQAAFKNGYRNGFMNAWLSSYQTGYAQAAVSDYQVARGGDDDNGQEDDEVKVTSDQIVKAGESHGYAKGYQEGRVQGQFDKLVTAEELRQPRINDTERLSEFMINFAAPEHEIEIFGEELRADSRAMFKETFRQAFIRGWEDGHAVGLESEL